MKAFDSIAARSKVPLFMIGDHASSFIPENLKNLGLKGDDLTRHIAWDIGTSGMIDTLCETFGCGAHKASVSRLVVDVHRDPKAAGVIAPRSDGTLIPGNLTLSAQKRAARMKIHEDYHIGLSERLDALMPLDPLLVSMHSFTPHPKTGQRRETDIGFLHKGDLATTLDAREQVKKTGRGYKVGLNCPYSAFDLYYTLDRHAIDRGLRHLMFEIRQDLVDTPAKVRDMSNIIASVLKPLL